LIGVAIFGQRATSTAGVGSVKLAADGDKIAVSYVNEATGQTIVAFEGP
jgi:hypothetical protein